MNTGNQNNIHNTWLLGIFILLLAVGVGVFFIAHEVLLLSTSIETSLGSFTPSLDNNVFEDHSVIVNNQLVILRELRALNLLSDCTIDTENIRSGEIPIDNQGGFRRVSIVQVVCPELQGT